MPRWNPIPSALCCEQSTDMERHPAENDKTNGYIFKRDIDRITGETRYIPKVCHAMPLYPKTYGLSCDDQRCQHCHPDTADEFPGSYYRPSTGWRANRHRHYYGYTYFPAPGTCFVGRKGCKPEKMIRIDPKKASDLIAKDDTRRRATRSEMKVEEEQDEGKLDKTQRLSKWEISASVPIDEGCELAISSDIVLPSDDWKADSWDSQLAFLASQGLLDDYEAEEADITLNSLRRDEDTYTIRYKADRRRGKTRKGQEALEAIKIGDDMDWELVLGSPSEGSMSWVVLEE
ncbi:hypothetical protein Daus18300_002264 [Diaporthe australafricana]|uniref:Uncharacterized protein n=1 Tax=Diaporthe australafricana TaxID=127596 RepID=A0ABR3XPI9_9PEZI